MIYVDQLRTTRIRKRWPYKKACHLIATSFEELIVFAHAIGLKPQWLHKGKIPHFDLTAPMRLKAVAAGAVEADIVTIIKDIRKRGISNEKAV